MPLLFTTSRPDESQVCAGYALQGSLQGTNRRKAGVPVSYAWCWENPPVPQFAGDATDTDTIIQSLSPAVIDRTIPFRAMSAVAYSISLKNFWNSPTVPIIRGADMFPTAVAGLLYYDVPTSGDPMPLAFIDKVGGETMYPANMVNFSGDSKIKSDRNSGLAYQIASQAMDSARKVAGVGLYAELIAKLLSDKTSGLEEEPADDGVAIYPVLCPGAEKHETIPIWELGTMDMAALRARGLTLNGCTSINAPVPNPASQVRLADRNIGALTTSQGVDCALSTLEGTLALEVAVSGFTMCPLVVNPVVSPQAPKDVPTWGAILSATNNQPFSLHATVAAIDCKLLGCGMEEDFFQSCGGVSFRAQDVKETVAPAWGGPHAESFANKTFSSTRIEREIVMTTAFPLPTDTGSRYHVNVAAANTGVDPMRNDITPLIERGSMVSFSKSMPLRPSKPFNAEAPPMTELGKRYGSQTGLVLPASRWQVSPHTVARVKTQAQVIDITSFWKNSFVKAEEIPLNPNNVTPTTDPIFVRPVQLTNSEFQCVALHIKWDGTMAAPFGAHGTDRVTMPLGVDPFVARATIVQQLTTTVSLLNCGRDTTNTKKLEHIVTDIDSLQILACTDDFFQTNIDLYALADTIPGHDPCYVRSANVARKDTPLGEHMQSPLTEQLQEENAAMYCGCMEYMPTKPRPAASSLEAQVPDFVSTGTNTEAAGTNTAAAGTNTEAADCQPDTVDPMDPWNWRVNLTLLDSSLSDPVVVRPTTQTLKLCTLQSQDSSQTWNIKMDMYTDQAPCLTIQRQDSTEASGSQIAQESSSPLCKSSQIWGFNTSVFATAGQIWNNDSTTPKSNVSLSLQVSCSEYPANIQIPPSEFGGHHIPYPARQITALDWSKESAVARLSIRAASPKIRKFVGVLRAQMPQQSAQDGTALPDLQFGVVSKTVTKPLLEDRFPIMSKALQFKLSDTRVHGLMVYLPVEWRDMLTGDTPQHVNSIVACRVVDADPPTQAAAIRVANLSDSSSETSKMVDAAALVATAVVLMGLFLS